MKNFFLDFGLLDSTGSLYLSTLVMNLKPGHPNLFDNNFVCGMQLHKTNTGAPQGNWPQIMHQ